MARSRSATAITAWSKRVIMLALGERSLEGGQHLAGHPLELGLLVVGGHPKGDRRSSSLDKGLDLLDALLGPTVGDPPLETLPVIIGVVVGVEKPLGLIERGLPILAYVYVVVEAGLEILSEVATLLLSVALDCGEVLSEGFRGVPGGLPAVGEADDAPQGCLDVPLLGRVRVGYEPDGDRLLHRPRQHRHVLEVVVRAPVAGFFLGSE